MNELYKVLTLCLISLLFVSFSKKNFPEYSPLITISCGIIMFCYTANYIQVIMESLNKFMGANGETDKHYSLLTRIFLISLACEVVSQLCSDSGESFLSDQIVFYGKIIIFTMLTPYIIKFLNLLFEAVQSI